MKYITTGYELTTAISNLCIFIVSVYGLINIKKDKLWKLFFLLMTIDSFFGVIVHGVVMSTKVNNILWIILTILFAITVNIIFSIFMNLKYKYVLIFTIGLGVILLVQLALNMNYLLTFTIYAILSVIISISYYLIKNEGQRLWFALGFITQLVGAVPLLLKAKIGMINHNGIYHYFMMLSLIFFYIGVKKKEKV